MEAQPRARWPLLLAMIFHQDYGRFIGVLFWDGAEHGTTAVRSVMLPDEWKEKFWARVENWSEELQDRKQDEIERLKKKLAELKMKLQRINSAFAEGTLDVDAFKDLKNPLVPKKVEIEQKIIALQTSRRDRLEPLRNWISEANQASKWILEENWLEMRSFLMQVGSNRLLRAQTLAFLL